MKRFLSALAAVVMVMSIIVPGAYAQENRSTDDLRALGIDTSHSVNVRDVVIRDPFVLVNGGIYYMYGTGASTVEGYAAMSVSTLRHGTVPSMSLRRRTASTE